MARKKIEVASTRGGVLADVLDTAPGSPVAAAPQAPTPIRLADLPEPPEHELTDLPSELSAEERANHELCIAAIRAGIRGFVLIGRALEYEQKAKAYRCEFPTFDDFTRTMFGFGRDRAEQFIRAWRVGAMLPETTPESHVRELLPVAVEHGDEAAHLVYETVVAEAPKVTAGVVRGAVGVLPEQWRKNDVVRLIRDYLRSEPVRKSSTPPEVRTVVKSLRAVTREVRAATSEGQRHEVAARLRRLADDLESPR